MPHDDPCDNFDGAFDKQETEPHNLDDVPFELPDGSCAVLRKIHRGRTVPAGIADLAALLEALPPDRREELTKIMSKRATQRLQDAADESSAALQFIQAVVSEKPLEVGDSVQQKGTCVDGVIVGVSEEGGETLYEVRVTSAHSLKLPRKDLVPIPARSSHSIWLAENADRLLGAFEQSASALGKALVGHDKWQSLLKTGAPAPELVLLLLRARGLYSDADPVVTRLVRRLNELQPGATADELARKLHVAEGELSDILALAVAASADSMRMPMVTGNIVRLATALAKMDIEASEPSQPETVGEHLVRAAVELHNTRHALGEALANVQELLESNTRLLEERRAVDRRYLVRHFMTLAEHPMPEAPCVPSEERVRFRMNLIMEEFVELLEAAWSWWGNGPDLDVQFTHPIVAEIKVLLRRLLMKPLTIDLVKWADATVDLDYVVEGARNEFGIDSNKIWTEVQRANMDKFKGEKVYDESGLKILKPEGWKPPDIEGVLRKQGWRGS